MLQPNANQIAPRYRVQLFSTLLLTIYFVVASTPLIWHFSFSTQLVQAVAAGVLGVVWLAARWRRGGGLRRTGLEWPLALLGLSQLAASAVSQQPRLSLESAANTLFWIMVVLVVADVVATGWPQRLLREALIVVALAVAGHGLWEVGTWFAGWLAVGQWPPFTYRLRGLLGSNYTATLCNLLLPFIVAQLLSSRRLRNRVCLGLLAAGLIVVVFFTSSRAGWLAGAAAMGVLALLLFAGRGALGPRALRYWQSRSRRWRVAVLAGLGAAALAGAWLLAGQANHSSHYSLFDSRDGIWNVAWEQFTLHPVAGMGPGLFPWYWSHYHSVPPAWFAGHAHSLVLQVLGGSGLLGLAALLVCGGAVAWRLWQAWLAAADQRLVAGLMAGLAGLAVHNLFDIPLRANLLLMLCAVYVALALAQDRRPAPAYAAGWLAVPMLLVGAYAAYTLRATYLHHQGLLLAAEDRWQPAAALFEQAAQADPGLTLYWEEAALAYAQAGETERALPLLALAQRDDPYWAVLPATAAVLRADAPAMQAARRFAPQSAFLALNEGALMESQGDHAQAVVAYHAALDLRPDFAASLFWEQSSMREAALAAWQPPAQAQALLAGWQALEAGQLAQAESQLELAVEADPFSPAAYVALAEVWWRRGNAATAQQHLATALELDLPSYEYHRVRGDWQLDEGNASAAMDAYSAAFDAIYRYTIAGPAPNNNGDRYAFVYRRTTLGSDLVPQFARPEVTGALDQRFARLGTYLAVTGDAEAGCFILATVSEDMPLSESSWAWRQLCATSAAQDLGRLNHWRATRHMKSGLPIR